MRPSAESIDRVQRIFARLLVRYNVQWLKRIELVDEEALIDDWARQLQRVSSGAIYHALMHLPEKFPPNAAEFKALCMARPERRYRALPAPDSRIPREEKTAILQRLGEVLKPKGDTERLAWARAMRDRHKAGESITEAEVTMYRTALREGEEATNSSLQFRPIAVELLPPAMQEDARRGTL
jgi:hypothetical protein